MKKVGLWTLGLLLVTAVLGLNSDATTAPRTVPHGENSVSAQPSENDTAHTSRSPTDETASPEEESTTTVLYPVSNVIDGDTIDVLIAGKVERVRLIGINTPETVDPRKTVECFGIEASNRAKALLGGVSVRLEADATQGDRDKYGRLLRYVFLADGTNFNLTMIEDGYAYEYTYNTPYHYQREFDAAETRARAAGAGLWGALCDTAVTAPRGTNEPGPGAMYNQTTGCTIKGNISSSGEKIYHVIGCASYNDTRIDEARGEAWFCSEAEAVAAGWRKAKNCS